MSTYGNAIQLVVASVIAEEIEDVLRQKNGCLADKSARAAVAAVSA